MFTFRLHSPDGDAPRRSDLPGPREGRRGAVLRRGRRYRVLDVVIFEEEDESPFVGLLQVEAA